MQRRIHKFAMIVLMTAIALLPLQGLHASMVMTSSVDTGVAQLVKHQSNSDSCLQKCENCQQRSCNDHHACGGGHCVSMSAVVLPGYLYRPEPMSQTHQVQYIDRVTLSPPSSLYRPPRS